MEPKNSLALRQAVNEAVSYAMEKCGLEVFRRTSLFGSNDSARTKILEKDAIAEHDRAALQESKP